MKIVIVGAGIAGCTAYLELQKHLPNPEDNPEGTPKGNPKGNHDITIYEAYDTGQDVDSETRLQGPTPTHSSTLLVGGGLGIAPNGLGVLERLDPALLHDVTRSGYVTPISNMRNKNGSLLMRLEANGRAAGPKEAAGAAAKMHTVATPRHLAWRSLRGRIPDQHIVRRKVLEVVTTVDGRNKVIFADGSEPVEADLVIGADGLHSIAKRALFPDAKEDPYPPSYQGLVGVGGFVPSADVKDVVERGSMNFVFGGNGFFGYFFADSDPSAPNRDSPYHVSEPGESLAWWSTYQAEECPDPKTLDMEDVARQLRERYSTWKDPVVKRVIESVSVRTMYPTWTSPPLPIWSRNGVVLLGDAAHTLPSTSGQGTSQALEDCEAFALFLAHQLQKAGQVGGASIAQAAQNQAIDAAAEQYTALRQPRVQQILEAAQKIQNSKRDMGVVGEYAMYGMMKVMSLFPGVMTKSMAKVANYNVADEVAKVIASE